MPRLNPLPQHLPDTFTTANAHHFGLTGWQLRSDEFEAPFRAVRQRRTEPAELNRFELARAHETAQIRALATRLREGQFFSHRSAALLFGAPMPHTASPDLHLSVRKPLRAPRVGGVTGHCFPAHRVIAGHVADFPVTSPAHTFAMLGDLRLADLVALGDYLVRVYRAGIGRQNVGKPPLTTIRDLAEVVALGRWRGSANLRAALTLIREDSWSPRESTTRLALVGAGLPEPVLNADVFDDAGEFLGCVDMTYPRYKVAVEYQGTMHAESYARDIERIEALRAAGWTVVQVTSELAARPAELVARVASALRERGWR